MYLNPPVEMARSKLIDQFHFWVSVITGLPRIQSSRYQVCKIYGRRQNKLCVPFRLNAASYFLPTENN